MNLWGPTVGLDIGASAVKLCQIKGRGTNRTLSRLGMEPLPSGTVVAGELRQPEEVVRAIASAHRAAGLRQRKAALAFSSPKNVFSRRLDLPLMTDEELAEQIRWEAEQHVPYSIEEVSLDHFVVHRDAERGAMGVLLVAARREDVEALTEVVRRAGLKPVGVEVAAIALGGLLRSGGEMSREQVVAMIDVGQSQTIIDVHQQGASLGARVIEVGGESIVAKIQAGLQVPREEAEAIIRGGAEPSSAVPYRGHSRDALAQRFLAEGAEAIAEEVGRVLDFIKAATPLESISRIFLTGGPAYADELLRALRNRVGAQIERWNPIGALNVDARAVDGALLEQDGQRFTLAAALAAESLESGWP